jgi:hypothetical protein
MRLLPNKRFIANYQQPRDAPILQNFACNHGLMSLSRTQPFFIAAFGFSISLRTVPRFSSRVSEAQVESQNAADFLDGLWVPVCSVTRGDDKLAFSAFHV